MKKGVFIYGLTDVKSISKPTGVDKKYWHKSMRLMPQD